MSGELAIPTPAEVVSLNPAWDYIKSIPQDTMFGSRRGVFTPSSFSMDDGPDRFVSYRDRVTCHWTWAIPSPEAIEFIVGVLDGRPVVEIGAGNGYWAWQLSQRGVDVKAYDLHPVGHPQSWFSEEHSLLRRASQELLPIEEFHPVEVGGAEKVEEHPDRVLLMIWPTMDTWAYDAVRHYEGDTVIYIGEGPGGCTADKNFFSIVGDGCGCWSDDDCLHSDDDAVFQRVGGGPMVQWSGLHDFLSVYNRKEA